MYATLFKHIESRPNECKIHSSEYRGFMCIEPERSISVKNQYDIRAQHHRLPISANFELKSRGGGILQ